MPGAAENGDQFGCRSLGALTGHSENILTISSPFTDSGVVYVLSDANDVPPRTWVSDAADRFGWAVSN